MVTPIAASSVLSSDLDLETVFEHDLRQMLSAQQVRDLKQSVEYLQYKQFPRTTKYISKTPTRLNDDISFLSTN